LFPQDVCSGEVSCQVRNPTPPKVFPRLWGHLSGLRDPRPHADREAKAPGPQFQSPCHCNHKWDLTSKLPATPRLLTQRNPQDLECFYCR
jgi:hypothetical protein